ncbi:hypothetical protein MACH08_42650 [Oceanobacillus kimchii]|uniref:CopG family transcriptional regulator n=1 Tax=Oceanobacillus kimchii TaxID=746691 RepID=A0ABQ5TNU0_9BACI|nr:hypothetical protein MACH08_42650 [Oceanobacillus kimchii]
MSRQKRNKPTKYPKRIYVRIEEDNFIKFKTKTKLYGHTPSSIIRKWINEFVMDDYD